jgi:hypothetical protein
VVAIAQRLDCRLDDEIRCPEIRLTDAEIDNVPALGRERVGTGKDRKGVFLADAVEGRDCTKHDGLSSGRGHPPAARPRGALLRRHFTRSDSKNQTGTEPS